MAALNELPHEDEDGILRAVVEAPKGARVKTKWDPELGAMVAGRTLPLGLCYPFDWGFIPGTRAEDGDPLDALILCEDASTWPGVVVPVRALGVLRIDQTTFFTAKDARSLGFAGPGAARRLVRQAVHAYEKER